MASKYTITNTAPGPRGFYSVDGYQELAPGETMKGVEISDAEHASAESTGAFKFGDKAAKVALDTDQDGLPNNVPKLKALAKAESIDVSGANTAADLQRLILAARADKAAAGTGGQSGGDDLDAMSDDDLRTTVQAITGTKPADDADRDQLLRLARGE